jgi:hypothetical protein
MKRGASCSSCGIVRRRPGKCSACVALEERERLAVRYAARVERAHASPPDTSRRGRVRSLLTLAAALGVLDLPEGGPR